MTNHNHSQQQISRVVERLKHVDNLTRVKREVHTSPPSPPPSLLSLSLSSSVADQSGGNINSNSNSSFAVTTPVTSSVFFYKNDDDLIQRLQLLLGSVVAGNTSNHVKSQIDQINDILYKDGVINSEQHREIFKLIYDDK